jgi:hypothetical protein
MQFINLSDFSAMKKVRLSNGDSTLIDDADLEKASQFAWHWHEDDRTRDYGHVCATWDRSRHKQVHITLHSLILSAPPGYVVDHRDNDPLNNQRANLRICTQQHNVWNRRKGRKRAYKGITLDRGKYKASIYRNGKATNLGRFDTPEEAALAYDTFAREHDGEFANLNFPDSQQIVKGRGRLPRTSTMKGATFHKASGKWMARKVVNGESRYLGLFASEAEAAMAVKKHSFLSARTTTAQRH